VKAGLPAAAAILLLVATPVHAHRLDEYLQATTIAVEKGRVEVEIRLAPGVAVYPAVLAAIDSDRDGAVSTAEQTAYAERVLGDLSLAVDGDRLRLRLLSWKFASMEDLKEGVGDIQIVFDAAVPTGGPDRSLTFENRHQSGISVYLVNGLVPTDPDIRATAQKRNYDQSFYRLDYVQAGPRSGPLSLSWWAGTPGWLGAAFLLGFAQLALLWRRRARAARDVDRGAMKV
jgi:hypothetical protein